jgi:hypothetical protein
MKSIIMTITVFCMVAFTATANAISVTCRVGPFAGMTNTAYVKIRTTGNDYYPPGFFYGMALARDFQGNVTGQAGGGYFKGLKQHANADMWIMYTSPPLAWRKLEASGGVAPWTGKKCPFSAYTQIIQ